MIVLLPFAAVITAMDDGYSVECTFRTLQGPEIESAQ